MMRSLWSAASGMIAQQTNLDVIANNLSNVNTVGHKKEVAEFKTLLYQTLQARTTTANGEQKPIPAQVGLGTRTASITSYFNQGNMLASDGGITDFAIDGAGFFAVRGEDGNTYYTRNGHFILAVGNNGLVLTNSEGLPVLDVNGRPIELARDIQSSKITVDARGNFLYPDATGNLQPMNFKIGLYQFNNPSGLNKMSQSLYGVTQASGAAINENNNNNIKPSTIRQGYLEGSNVQVADEMVNMIIAQRAYEMNSKAIQASDEMLGQANNLKR